MKIYTKTGDGGDTSLFGGMRVPKSSPRIHAYGSVDELNSQIGVVRACKPHDEVDKVLNDIQEHLFVLAADLATPVDAAVQVRRISRDHVDRLEHLIDNLEKQLDPLRSFIYPGGSPACANLHMARTVARRAERYVDALKRTEKIGDLPLIYINRLADLLFVLARFENKLSGIEENKWVNGSKI